MEKIIINTLFPSLVFISKQLLAQISALLLTVSSDVDNFSLSWSKINYTTGYQLFYAAYPYQGIDKIKKYIWERLNINVLPANMRSNKLENYFLTQRLNKTFLN